MSLSTKCLVTGGAGFIGSNLCDELIRQGAKVIVLDNLITGFRENLEEIKGDFEFVEGDINDSPLLERILPGIDTVFHQAALPSVPRSVDDPQETHQACVMDACGNIVREFVVHHTGESIREFLRSLEAASDEPSKIAVGIEVPRGPIVEALLE